MGDSALEHKDGDLSSHDLWETGEPGVPEQILDRNGEVVLWLCKACGKGEGDLLGGPCSGRRLKQEAHSE